MEEIVAALIVAGAKLGGKAIAAFASWSQAQAQGTNGAGYGAMAIAPDGSRRSLASTGGVLAPRGLGVLAAGQSPVGVQIRFVPADRWAQAYLLTRQPTLVVIERLGLGLAQEPIVVATFLEDGADGALYPGLYRLSAFVFLNNNLDAIDGIGIVDFSVEVGEPPFLLRVPIDAVPEPEAVFAALTMGSTPDGGSPESRCEARTRTKQRCRNGKTQGHPLFCALHAQQSRDGLPVIHHETGEAHRVA